MLDAVGRQLFSSGFKKSKSSGVNSTLAHKAADDVVNGANSTALQKFGKAVVKGAMSAGEKAAESIVNNAIDSTKKVGCWKETISSSSGRSNYCTTEKKAQH